MCYHAIERQSLAVIGVEDLLYQINDGISLCIRPHPIVICVSDMQHELSVGFTQALSDSQQSIDGNCSLDLYTPESLNSHSLLFFFKL